jgi:hypothetical protein
VLGPADPFSLARYALRTLALAPKREDSKMEELQEKLNQARAEFHQAVAAEDDSPRGCRLGQVHGPAL